MYMSTSNGASKTLLPPSSVVTKSGCVLDIPWHPQTELPYIGCKVWRQPRQEGVVCALGLSRSVLP